MFNTLEFILQLLIIAFCMVILYTRARYFTHMVQQLGYIPSEYRQWLKDNPKRAYTFKKDNDIAKKPLVMTPRATRLLVTQLVIDFLILFIFPIVYIAFKPSDMGLLFIIIAMIFVALMLFFYHAIIMAIALYIINPYEKLVHRKFFKQAQTKVNQLKLMGLKVIAITGSYGKTSTKQILYQMIKDKVKTYSSPESYNTPMGLSKIINNELDESYQYFIAEMGARYTGEIEELVRLVTPDIGVITNIGPCHLETFGSMENIIKTKFELADGVINKSLILNFESDEIRHEAERRGLISEDYVETIGLSYGDLRAEVVEVSDEGTKFNILFKDEVLEAHTKLLGSHNILNILMATKVALKIGMSHDEIIKAISGLEQIEHRLNLVKNPNGVIVIDDAFNSNPSGARAALNVLHSFKGGKKIIVTPGMVELGEAQYNENYMLGKEIANNSDISIIVGNVNRNALSNGIDEIKNSHKKYLADDLNAATSILSTILERGDVVLFENDLTDIY